MYLRYNMEGFGYNIEGFSFRIPPPTQWFPPIPPIPPPPPPKPPSQWFPPPAPFWNNVASAFGIPNSSDCNNKKTDTNNKAGTAEQRAGEAENYANAANLAANDAESYAANAESIAKSQEERLIPMQEKLSVFKSDFQKIIDKYTLETDEEKQAFKEITLLANPIIDSLQTFVNDMTNNSVGARSQATSARNNAKEARSNATSSRGFANESRSYATNTRNNSNTCDSSRINTVNSSYQTCLDKSTSAKGSHDSAQTYKTNALAAYNAANTNKSNIDSAYTDYTNNANKKFMEPLAAIVKKMDDYSHNHDFGWLKQEIERISGLKEDTEKQKKIDQSLVDRDTAIKKQYDASLNAYLDSMKVEKSKGSAYDQAVKIYSGLQDDLKVCTSAIDKYKEEIKDANGRIALINSQILAEQTNITTNTLNKDKKINEMNENIKQYSDLSGQVIDLQNKVSTIQSLITQEETRYFELLETIEYLKLTIIELKEKIYSNKVVNSQNILNYSEIVDNDLHDIFSYLKTKNVNPDLLYTKVKYRDIEKEKLINTDKILDVMFYCFYLAFIFIIIFTRNIKSEHFLIYILIGLIPFVYPVLFKNITNILKSFNQPKTETELESQMNHEFDAYNV